MLEQEALLTATAAMLLLLALHQVPRIRAALGRRGFLLALGGTLAPLLDLPLRFVQAPDRIGLLTADERFYALYPAVCLLGGLGLLAAAWVGSRAALRMGGANIFVLVITSMTVTFLNAYVLPYAPYLQLISFIVVIASLVQIVETVVKKVSPGLFRELGIFLPLITTNCAILGLAIFQTNKGYDFVEGLFYAVGGGLGLTLALVLLASIREQTELIDVPRLARGMGLVLILAGSLSLAFMGFAGLFSS